jgi:hypothetical protein
MIEGTAERTPGSAYEDGWRAIQNSIHALVESQRETDEQIGRLSNKLGDLVEHLVAPNLQAKFNELGFTFSRTYTNAKYFDDEKNLTAEVDVFLENGDCAVAVEVKTELKIDDVKRHVKRMEIIRRHADAKGDTRRFYGAMAAAIADAGARNYAVKTGFYVIVQSGDTMRFDIPDGFRPRAW